MLKGLRAGGLMIAAAAGALLGARAGRAQTAGVYGVTLREAEARALRSSNQLKSYVADQEAAVEQADAQYALLFPRVTFEASFQYISDVPSISLPAPFPSTFSIPFGSNTPYSVGPVIRYTLWDTGASRDAYHGFSRLAESRDEDRKNAELQLLLSVRETYVAAQLGLEELRLINDSLGLSRAQERDVSLRFRGGAATRLDLVTAHRAVLGTEIQFEQRQVELSATFKDLLALLGDSALAHPERLAHPGPPLSEKVGLVLLLDPLQATVAEESRAAEIPPPGERQPRIRSQELLAESAELSASSNRSQLYPVIQASFKTSLDYPNGPILTQINQNTVSLSLSMPLWEGSRSRHLAEQQLKTADSARSRGQQLRIDLMKDYAKAHEMLASLRDQRQLASQDISQSEEGARLNYDSYKAGKINFTDVQNANNQALQSKVNAARIDAQILDQLAVLKALSGKELSP